MIIASSPIIIIFILFFTAFIIPMIKNKTKVKVLSISSIVLCMLLSLLTCIYVYTEGTFIYTVGHWDAPWGIEFQISMIEALLSLTFTTVMTLIIWQSLSTIESEISETKIGLYYSLISVVMASLLGIVYSNDIFNCFVFMEVNTLASCGIIVIKENKENIRATMKYLVLGCLGSGLVLLGIAFLYSITGNLNMTYIHNEIVNIYFDYKNIIVVALGLFTVGLGVKSAMFPLHIWLPDAHSSAPSTSSAILSSLVIKATAIYLIKILFRVFGFGIIKNFYILDIILILGSSGMIFGSLLAIFQKNIKRLIAYSSIAQMGYIFLGIGLGNELGLITAVYHIIAHALTKSALFMIAGIFIHKLGTKSIKDFKGIGKHMPILLGAFTIGALSMVGIPILPGFVSKFNLALACIQAGKYMFLAVILISSLLNAVYYLPIVINGFFNKQDNKSDLNHTNKIQLKEIIPILILIIMMGFIGLSSNSIINLIKLGI